MKTTLGPKRIALGLVFASLMTAATVADAGHTRFAVSGQANVSVWLEGGDVFEDYADVAIWLRPEIDCYTTLFMVDTDGFVHVLYPTSPYDATWLYGGRSYCYRASDLGLDRLDGAGIAYVFAVGSPAPFDYSYYGASVFVGGFGFRVYGDPFVACRNFYVTLLPGACRWDYVGVSYARFYVRRWERYPSYLCYGGPGVHVRVGDGCRTCDDVYVSYRASCARPIDVFQPVPKFKSVYDGGGYQARAEVRESRIERVRPTGSNQIGNNKTSYKQTAEFKSSHKQTREAPSHEFRAKQFSKSTTARSNERTVVTHQAQGRSFKQAGNRTGDRARVVSTSSARERASVDKADVSAMKKQTSHAVRPSRSNEARDRGVETKKSAQGQAAREKGTKKKIRQAR
jgi:hypothetical protein